MILKDFEMYFHFEVISFLLQAFGQKSLFRPQNTTVLMSESTVKDTLLLCKFTYDRTREKGLQDLRTGLTQTWLHSHRTKLEA